MNSRTPILPLCLFDRQLCRSPQIWFKICERKVSILNVRCLIYSHVLHLHSLTYFDSFHCENYIFYHSRSKTSAVRINKFLISRWKPSAWIQRCRCFPLCYKRRRQKLYMWSQSATRQRRYFHPETRLYSWQTVWTVPVTSFDSRAVLRNRCAAAHWCAVSRLEVCRDKMTK